MTRTFRHNFRRTAALAILMFACCMRTAMAADASLFLAPITGTFKTGTDITLFVLVGSGGQSVNAIEGKLEFDPKELQVVSTERETSVLTSWTQPPTFDNELGTVSFGGLLATGTVLARGEVMKLTLRTLRSGELHVRFASGAAVHAADGTGGNILSQLSGGVYVTTPNEIVPLAENPEPQSLQQGEVLGAATGTVIVSSTHPDQGGWYATTTGKFSWEVLPGTSGYLMSFDKKHDGKGARAYPATIREKTIADIGDGVWYFHLTRSIEGGGEEDLAYRVAVDTKPPESVTVSEAPRADQADPNVSIVVSATDTLSGIDHYEFALNGGSPVAWVDDGTHRYTLENVNPGTHDLSVFAVDKAGNRAAGHIEFTVATLPPPSLTIMNRSFIEGDTLALSVTSLPSATVDIAIARAGASPVIEETSVDAKGHADYRSALTLLPGSYEVFATLKKGTVSSEESEHLSFEVNSSVVGVMKRHPMIPVAALFLLILMIGSIFVWKRYLRRVSDEAEMNDEVATLSAESYEPKLERIASVKSAPQGAVVLGKRPKSSLPATRL